MKHAIPLILILLLLSGCALPPLPTEAPPPTIPEISVQQPTEATQPPTEPRNLTFTLYLPDGTAEHFVTQQVWVSQITADSVLLELQRAKLLPETVIINAFGASGDQLIIDFNSAFADIINSVGTSGERMIIGSMVNTFLNAFQAQSVVLTVDGETLESGHVIYDFPITFMK